MRNVDYKFYNTFA